jgi:putative peptidoglycan lipid II flippase
MSAILGFVRESYIAYSFGASGFTDAFYIALVVPDIIAGWVSLALTNALIPVLKVEMQRSSEGAKILTSNFFWGATIVLVAATAVVIVFRGEFINLLAPHYNNVHHLEAENLLFIMAPAIVFTGLAGVLWGIHNARENFLFPALLGTGYNIILMTVAILLQSRLGIDALAYGVLGGAIARFAIQFIPLIVIRGIDLSRIRWHSGIPAIFKSIGSFIVSTGVTSLNTIVDRILASGLPAGHLTDLNYASRVGLFPYGTIGISLATVLYTRFIVQHIDENNDGIKRVLGQGYSILIFLSIVLMSIFVVYPKDIINILFHHGLFTANDVQITSLPLIIYGVSMAGYLVSPMILHYFYARKRNRFVLMSSFVGVGINIIGSVCLVRPLGIVGLVLANAIAVTVMTIIQSYVILLNLKWSAITFFRDYLLPGIVTGMVFSGGVIIEAYIYSEPHLLPTIYIIMRVALGVSSGIGFVLLYGVFTKRNIAKIFLFTK